MPLPHGVLWADCRGICIPTPIPGQLWQLTVRMLDLLLSAIVLRPLYLITLNGHLTQGDSKLSFAPILTKLPFSPVQRFKHPANFSHYPDHPLQTTCISLYTTVRILSIHCFSPETKYSLSIQKFPTRKSQREEIQFLSCLLFFFFKPSF